MSKHPASLSSALGCNFSRECSEKLRRYVELLVEWSEKFNMISETTVGDAWHRHIEDSAQLFPILHGYNSVLDVGSGSGLPGIVLSILGAPVTMVESSHKKTVFIETVIRELELSARVKNNRVENVEGEFDAITCRGFADIHKVISLTKKFSPKFFVLPKGEGYMQEINSAKKHWCFQYELIDSVTSNKSKIVVIRELAEHAKSSENNLNCKPEGWCGENNHGG